MKLFMSHASRDKALLWEVKSCMPEYFDVWIDEEKLRPGQVLAEALEAAISQDSDFFILFVDNESINSKWVRQEIEWALDVEQKTGRNLLVPVVLDRDAWDRIEPPELRKRTYIRSHGYDRRAARALADEIAHHVHSWMVEDIRRLQQKVSDSQNQKVETDGSMGPFNALSLELLKIIHKHDRDSPITIQNVYGQVQDNDMIRGMSLGQFQELFDRLRREVIFQGIFFDGEKMFTHSISHGIKGQVYIDEKREIAGAALRLIEDDSIVSLDGGSTTGAIASLIVESFRAGILSNLSVITNSVPAALELTRAKNAALKVYLAGGLVRANSLAVVPPRRQVTDGLTQIMEVVGQVDLALVGTSGLSEEGLSTRTGEESRTKQALLAHGAQHVVVTDSSKFGLRLNHIFSSLENLHVITAKKEGDEEVLAKYQQLLADHNSVLDIV